MEIRCLDGRYGKGWNWTGVKTGSRFGKQQPLLCARLFASAQSVLVKGGKNPISPNVINDSHVKVELPPPIRRFLFSNRDSLLIRVQMRK
jgi:hypothetical protein